MNWQPKAKKWRLINVTMRWFDAQGNVQIQKQPTMDSLRILPAHLARSTNDVALLTLPQASVYMDELQRSGSNNIGQPMTLYYSKFTYPFANLVVIFLGIALAATRRKGGQSVQIAIGLIVAFVYLALIKIIEPFGYSGELDPLLTAILPHAFFLVLGLIMLWRTRK
jgi:lipopolysaccharide export system permease protein